MQTYFSRHDVPSDIRRAIQEDRALQLEISRDGFVEIHIGVEHIFFEVTDDAVSGFSFTIEELESILASAKEKEGR